MFTKPHENKIKFLGMRRIKYSFNVPITTGPKQLETYKQILHSSLKQSKLLKKRKKNSQDLRFLLRVKIESITS